jgi:hypothetical protein
LLHPLHGAFDISNGRGEPVPGREPVIDGEPREAGAGQHREERLDVSLFVSPDESAAMDDDYSRKRASTVRYGRIQRQTHAIGFREFDICFELSGSE